LVFGVFYESLYIAAVTEYKLDEMLRLWHGYSADQLRLQQISVPIDTRVPLVTNSNPYSILHCSGDIAVLPLFNYYVTTYVLPN